jgi:hypothetical protein
MCVIPEKQNYVTMETISFGHPGLESTLSASSKVTRNLEPLSHLPFSFNLWAYSCSADCDPSPGLSLQVSIILLLGFNGLLRSCAINFVLRRCEKSPDQGSQLFWQGAPLMDCSGDQARCDYSSDILRLQTKRVKGFDSCQRATTDLEVDFPSTPRYSSPVQPLEHKLG